MEQDFIKWLRVNRISEYKSEHQIKNTEIGTCYYADFYFPSLSLIIELDGIQHEQKIEQDKYRDQYIFKTYGISTHRIKYVEYKTRTWEAKVLSMLKK